ncbi:VWD domain-containing protein [Planktothrix sp. FACHB-1365]|uniref:VWD domain-containing protein n=1 Tax=Planktothrix sp. FACHB-1365 TaxID=2692855 RepID=UPI001683B9E3|nr:VWD domain-containing protein [Planktothrix sp. FACHB-1365]MBD2484481.1 FG-GAP repeat protein [Planktothrix sp. FACHB-1365]
MNTLLTTGTTQTTTIEKALQVAQNYLSDFASSADFNAKMQLAFGNHKIWDKADLIDFPTIEIRPGSEINNARGAFATATNTIYLSQELVDENTGNVGAIASVLLEEYGHYIDAQNNAIDSPGDEGELFADLFLGKGLSESELLGLWGENDSAIVVWDGEGVSIEQQVQSDTLDFSGNNVRLGQNLPFNGEFRYTDLAFELNKSGKVEDLGFGFNWDINAFVGLVPFVNLFSLGDASFKYPITVDFDLPNNVELGENFEVKLTNLATGTLSLDGAGLELLSAGIDLEYSLGPINVKDVYINRPPSLNTQEVDLNTYIPSTNNPVPAQTKAERSDLNRSKDDKIFIGDLINYSGFPKTTDNLVKKSLGDLNASLKFPLIKNVLDLKVTLPKIETFTQDKKDTSSIDSRLPSIKAKGTTKDSFITLSGDIDAAIIKYLPAAKPLKTILESIGSGLDLKASGLGFSKDIPYSEGRGKAVISADLLDVKGNLGVGLQEELTFEPKGLSITMSMDGGQEQKKSLIDFLGSEPFSFTAPSEGCGVMELKARYELIGEINTSLSPTVQGSLDTQAIVVNSKNTFGPLEEKRPPLGPLAGPFRFPEGSIVIPKPIVSSNTNDSNAFFKVAPIQIDKVGNNVRNVVEITYKIPYNLPISILDATPVQEDSKRGDTTNFLTFTVKRREVSDQPLTLTIETGKKGDTATQGSDYFLPNNTVTIPAGKQEESFFVAIVGDKQKEGDETLTVTLKDPSGQLFAECEGEVDSISATGTIIDNDEKEEPDPPEPNPHEFNDPRYITIDGKSLDFQAAGEFTLLESLNDDYKIQVRQQPVGNDPLKNASNATAVATILGGKRVGLYQDSQQLLIDGVPTTIPDNEYIFVGEGRIYREGNQYSFVYPKGDQLIATMTENRINVSLFLSPERRDTVRGIFGTYNDNPDDDILKRDGTVLTEPISVEQLYGEYADSWRVSQTESLFDYQPGEDTNTFTISNYPRQKVKLSDLDPADVQKAEELIGDRITDPIIRETAIIDLVLTDFDPDIIESAINVPSPESSVIIRVEPQATADFTSTFANTPVKINPLSNDIVTTGIPLSLTGYDQTTAKGGTIQLDNNGTPDDKTDDQLTYTPPTNFVGVDTINYTIADDQTTATGTITVTVPAINLTDLNGNNGFTVTGAAGNFAGSSVSNIGDFNGDTIDDFIVGGFAADPNNINATGESYVIFGTNQGFPANFDLSTLNGTNGFIIEGFEAESFSGGAVSSAGDLNGDGLKDVMIGAFASNSNSLNDSGRTYIVFGSNQPFSTRFNLANLDGNNGFVINSNQPLDYSGIAVSSAGDFNADGLDDLAVAAPAGIDTFLGKIYLVYGRRTNFPPAFNPSDLEDDKGTIINHNNGLAGTTVSNAGDINGDEIDDLIIGTEQGLLEGNPKAGETYVLFGKDGGYPNGFSLSNLNGNNGFTIKGDGYSVSSVSGAGDINADGLEDILIGVSQSPGNDQTNAGKAYVVFGTQAGYPQEFDLFTLDGNNGFVVNGVEPDELLGGSVKAAGDMNGDQIDDIIIGASGATANGIKGAGKTYIIWGTNKGFPASLNSSELNGENGFFINGTAENELSGVAVSSAGDINKDNVNDILIGAPGSLFDNTAGKGYVVFGHSTFGNQPVI